MGTKAVVQMHHSTKTDSLLIGYVVAEFDIPDKRIKGTVVGSGKTLRVTVDGYDGYVDIDCTKVVSDAIKLITEGG